MKGFLPPLTMRLHSAAVAESSMLNSNSTQAGSERHGVGVRAIMMPGEDRSGAAIGPP